MISLGTYKRDSEEHNDISVKLDRVYENPLFPSTERPCNIGIFN